MYRERRDRALWIAVMVFACAMSTPRGGKAEIVLLGSGSYSYAGIAATEHHIYYAAGSTTNDKIRRLSIASGAVEEVATSTYSVTDFLYREGSLYWSHGNLGGGGVCRFEELTSQISCFAEGNQPKRLAASSDYLYWGESNGGPAPNRLYRMQFPEGEVELVSEDAKFITAIAPLDPWVYFARTVPGTSSRQIARVPVLGGSVEGVVGTSENAKDMRILSGRAYWIESAAGLLRSAYLDGSDVQTVMSGLVQPYALDSDGRSLFVAEQGTSGIYNGRILNIQLSGEVHVLAQGLDRPRDVTVRAGSVYWNDGSGFRRYCPGSCDPPEPDPILLVHGLASNGTTWHQLTDMLEGEGLEFAGYPQFDRTTGQVVGIFPGKVYSMHFSDAWSTYPSQSLTLAEQGQEIGKIVAAIRAVNPGVVRVRLVGHSMGGLAVRTYLQELAAGGVQYAEDVAQLVTIGTPHHGSMLAAICNSPIVGVLCLALNVSPSSVAVQELEPGSPSLAQLADLTTNPLPEAVRFAAVVATGEETLWISEVFVDGDGVVPAESQDPQILIAPWAIFSWAPPDRGDDCGALGLEVHTCETADPFIMDLVIRLLRETVLVEGFEGGDMAGWSLVVVE